MKISALNALHFNVANNKSVKLKNQANQLMQRQSNSYNLENMNSIYARASINFTGNKPLSEKTIHALNTAATTQILGKHPWPKIGDVHGIMPTAETQTFMKTGGLAEVAVQLPDAFNKKYSDNPNNSLDIITPLYVGSDSRKGGKTASIEDLGDNKYLYKGAQNQSIELEKIGSFPVKIYDDWQGKHVDEEVGVLTGNLNGTKYIFLQNDRYFNVTPSEDNNPACFGPYVGNINGIKEVERMAFFSKSIYNMMKETDKGNLEGIDKPNVILANDWHASPISAMTKYFAPVERDQEEISDETFEYINNIPIIHITHNAEYQGSDWEQADKIFKTLFEEETTLINNNIKGFNQNGFPLSDGWGNINLAKSDINLADRVIAVSPNYAKELCTEDFGAGLEYEHQLRRAGDTISGIVNGYEKRLAEPNEKMINNINTKLNPETKFIAYDNMYNENGYEIKMQNKNASIDLYKKFITDSKNGTKLPGFELYAPDKCNLDGIENATNVPVIASVGRLTDQKGYDTFADAIVNTVKNLKEDQEAPIVVVLGSGSDQIMGQLKGMKDRVAEFNQKAAERILVFEGFSAELRDAIGISSDFFGIPSNWEPCGLTQEEVMPKGSLPVVTATGGLVDTIIDGVDGFVTEEFFGHKTKQQIFGETKEGIKNNVDAYTKTLSKALNTFYSNPEKIKEMAIKAMEKDFNWDIEGGSLDKYDTLMRTGKID